MTAGAGPQDQPPADAGLPLVHWRLARIEEQLNSHAAQAINPESYRLAQNHLVRRIELLEEAATEDRRNRRTTTTGVLVALVVPLVTYIGQLTQMLPTG